MRESDTVEVVIRLRIPAKLLKTNPSVGTFLCMATEAAGQLARHDCEANMECVSGPAEMVKAVQAAIGGRN